MRTEDMNEQIEELEQYAAESNLIRSAQTVTFAAMLCLIPAIGYLKDGIWKEGLPWLAYAIVGITLAIYFGKKSSLARWSGFSWSIANAGVCAVLTYKYYRLGSVSWSNSVLGDRIITLVCGAYAVANLYSSLIYLVESIKYRFIEINETGKTRYGIIKLFEIVIAGAVIAISYLTLIK